MSNTIYSHISENKRDTLLVIAMFPISLFLLMFVFFLIFGDRTNNISLYNYLYQTAESIFSFSSVLFGIAIIWMGFAYFFGDDLILTSIGSNEITKTSNAYVYNLVENTAIAAGLPVPKVYIVNDHALNAFATGRDPHNASVVLTSGIIKTLTKQELEGVIAHELSHIGNRDIRTMLLVVSGIGCFTFLGSVALRLSASIRSDKKNSDQTKLILFLVAIGLMIFGYIIAPLIRLALSRKREYQADATAALITRNPIALASALKKISANPNMNAFDRNQLASDMCIENPLNNSNIWEWLSKIMSTHPPVEKRIEVLERMAV